MAYSVGPTAGYSAFVYGDTNKVLRFGGSHGFPFINYFMRVLFRSNIIKGSDVAL